NGRRRPRLVRKCRFVIHAPPSAFGKVVSGWSSIAASREECRIEPSKRLVFSSDGGGKFKKRKFTHASSRRVSVGAVESLQYQQLAHSIDRDTNLQRYSAPPTRQLRMTLASLVCYSFELKT